MQDVKSPNEISITTEAPVITKDAFYTIGFIYEDDGLNTPDYLYVSGIKDVVNNNFMYASKSYSVVKSVFKINKKCNVVLLKKYKTESYQDCYDRNNTSEFYFTVIESKDIDTLLEFQNHIKDEFKLLFFSTNQNVTEQVADLKMVYYYQKEFSNYVLLDSGDITETDYDDYLILKKGRFDYSTGIESYWNSDNREVLTTDEDNKLLLEYHDIDEEEANETESAYPEVCWITRCSQRFPTQVQWLYKTLEGVDVNYVDKIPHLSNSQVYVNSTNAVIGTGASCRGLYIEHEVGLDWLKYAIQSNIWNHLYKIENKINSTQAGLSILENLLKQVLDVAKTTNLFTTYQITEIKVDRSINTASMKFKAELAYSILGVDIDGVVYH